MWCESLRARTRELERERRASLLDDAVRRRYYLRQWRRLLSRVAEDAEVGVILEGIENFKRLSDAWTSWTVDAGARAYAGGFFMQPAHVIVGWLQHEVDVRLLIRRRYDGGVEREQIRSLEVCVRLEQNKNSC